MDVALTDGVVEIIGSLDLDRTDTGISPRRLPAWTRPQIPDLFMEFMVTLGSGVRIAFRTDAPWIELDVMPTGFEVIGSPPPVVAYDLVVDGTRVDRRAVDFGTRLVLDLATLAVSVRAAPAGTVRFDDLGDAMKSVELWLPQSAASELRALRVPDGARVEAPTHGQRRWVHYGSSISHCVEAHGPTDVWPAVAARLGDVELLQLAFAGQCQLDQFVARTIGAQPVDLISFKVGINVVNANSLTERTFPSALHGFLDTVREHHPEVPLLVASPIICPMVEAHPGPTVPDGAGGFRIVEGGPPELRATDLTLQRIRTIVAEVVAGRQTRGDDRLHHLDGLELFGPADVGDLPDGLHPNGDGYLRMGERFAAHAFAPGGPFAG
jgi:hypothetical protein